MATKIRLARKGRKKLPVYSIVIASASAPRDGRFIEKIGFYSPLLAKDNPQRVVIKNERANFWLKTGATPTSTVMHMLSRVTGIDIPQKLQKKFVAKAKKNTGIKVKKSASNS